MKSPASLPKGAAFDLAYAKGSVKAGPFFVVRTLPNVSGEARWGFAVGKKQWRKATDRNRVRMRLRVVARRISGAPGADIVITARARADRASLDELSVALRQQLGLSGDEPRR